MVCSLAFSRTPHISGPHDDQAAENLLGIGKAMTTLFTRAFFHEEKKKSFTSSSSSSGAWRSPPLSTLFAINECRNLEARAGLETITALPSPPV